MDVYGCIYCCELWMCMDVNGPNSCDCTMMGMQHTFDLLVNKTPKCLVVCWHGWGSSGSLNCWRWSWSLVRIATHQVESIRNSNCDVVMATEGSSSGAHVLPNGFCQRLLRSPSPNGNGQAAAPQAVSVTSRTKLGLWPSWYSRAASRAGCVVGAGEMRRSAWNRAGYAYHICLYKNMITYVYLHRYVLMC